MSNIDKTNDIKNKIIEEYTQYLTDFTFKFKNGNVLKTHKYLLFKDSDYFNDFFKSNPNIYELDFTKDDSQIISNYDNIREYLTVFYAYEFKTNDEQKNLFDIYDLDKLIDLHKYLHSQAVIQLCSVFYIFY